MILAGADRNITVGQQDDVRCTAQRRTVEEHQFSMTKLNGQLRVVPTT